MTSLTTSAVFARVSLDWPESLEWSQFLMCVLTYSYSFVISTSISSHTRLVGTFSGHNKDEKKRRKRERKKERTKEKRKKESKKERKKERDKQTTDKKQKRFPSREHIYN